MEFGRESSAAAVFASLRALVTAQAATHAAWRDFSAGWWAILDPATEACLTAGLAAERRDGVDYSCNTRNMADEDGEETHTAAVGKNCRDETLDVFLRVAMLDGTTFSVTVPERGCVREVKREVAKVLAHDTLVCLDGDCRVILSVVQSQGTAVGLMDLFVSGTENALPEDGRVDCAPIAGAAALFVLQKTGQCCACALLLM
jgi:hypothetical protein